MQIERAKSQPDQQLQGAIGHRAAAEEPSGRIRLKPSGWIGAWASNNTRSGSSRSVLANCSGCARGRCASSKTAMRQRMSSGENNCAIPRSTSGVTNNSRSCASTSATRSRRRDTKPASTSRNRRNAGADGCAAARSNRSRPSPRAGQFGVADIGHRRTAQDQVGDIARGTPDAGEGGLDGRDAPTHGATRQPSSHRARCATTATAPGYGAARASGSAVQVAQDPGHGAAGQQALRDGPGLPGSRRRRGLHRPSLPHSGEAGAGHEDQAWNA